MRSMLPIWREAVERVVNRTAETRPEIPENTEKRPRLVQIGQISYGLYLWHFPIFVSCRIWLPDATYPFHVSHGIIGTALTFACAGASYRWLERPCREAGRRITIASRARSGPVTRAEPSGVGL